MGRRPCGFRVESNVRCAVVLASAPGALEELALAPAGTDVIAVNAAGCLYPMRLAAWGSVHADQLFEWVETRRARHCNIPAHVFGESFLPGQARDVVEYYGPVRWRGSSALYAVQWALEHAYDRVALAGVHLTGSMRERCSGLEATDGSPYDVYRAGWRDALEHIEGRVTSFGGWTAELLGTPPRGFFTEG